MEKMFFLSDEAPIRSDEDKCWYHPEYEYRCTGHPWMIGEPTSSANIQEFYGEIGKQDASMKS